MKLATPAISVQQNLNSNSDCIHTIHKYVVTTWQLTLLALAVHTYIHTRTFIKRLLTKRIQSAIGKGKTGGKKARAKEKGNQLIGKKMTFKRLLKEAVVVVPLIMADQYCTAPIVLGHNILTPDLR